MNLVCHSQTTYCFSEDQNISNNAKTSRGSKRTRQPKRHVSFVSDRSVNDDTLADVPTHLDEPRWAAGDTSPTAK